MIQNRTILLGKGLENVRFGARREEVKQTFGEPDQTEKIADEEELNTHIWHYTDQQLTFIFEEFHDNKLSAIITKDDHYLVRDLIRVGMQKQHVLDSLEELNFLEYAEEDHSDIDSPNRWLVAIDDKSLFLWFEDDVLVEIEWFPFYDEFDEMIWPTNQSS